MKGISAVVATYKRRDELKNLLNSIVTNHFPLLEVIIVDQNTDNLIDDIVAEFSSLLTIKHMKLKAANQSLARNLGVKEARYPIVCFPDDDCWYDNDSLEKISRHFSAHEDTELLIVNWKQNKRPGGENSQFIEEKSVYSYKAPIHYGTIVFYFKKDVFIDLGGFNESIGIGFYIGAGEDCELLFRAAKKNVGIYYDAGIFINHKLTLHSNRNLKLVRARERATGFIYSTCKVPVYVLLRGLFSPFLRMLFCFNKKEVQTNYNVFVARIEGYIYGFRT